jgi:hypothetical protein
MPYHTAVFTSNAKLTFSAILVSFSEFKGIGSVTGIAHLGNIFGPSKTNWQLLLQMQWAHPRASAAPAGKVMGLGNVIGSYHCKSNGPILEHWQHLPEK